MIVCLDIFNVSHYFNARLRGIEEMFSKEMFLMTDEINLKHETLFIRLTGNGIYSKVHFRAKVLKKA